MSAQENAKSANADIPVRISALPHDTLKRLLKNYNIPKKFFKKPIDNQVHIVYNNNIHQHPLY